jgi:exopolysaccharide biosynthesis protein
VTLTELANILLRMGARDAMNFDGGGSTAMVVQGRVLNLPSDGCERAVSNALLVVKR